MPQFNTGVPGQVQPVAPPPFDIDPATGLPGGAGFPPGFGDDAFVFGEKKAEKTIAERVASFVVKVGIVSSEIGGAVFTSTAGAGEEAAIAEMIEKNNALIAARQNHAPVMGQAMATTDP